MASLVLRKRRDGSREIVGEAPELHTFSARWIERELGDLVHVAITVRADGGDVIYELEGFEPVLGPDGKQMTDAQGLPAFNWTGLVARKA